MENKQTNKHIKISTTMSYALRHNPKAYGLTMDEYGNVDINKLLIG